MAFLFSIRGLPFQKMRTNNISAGKGRRESRPVKRLVDKRICSCQIVRHIVMLHSARLWAAWRKVFQLHATFAALMEEWRKINADCFKALNPALAPGKVSKVTGRTLGLEVTPPPITNVSCRENLSTGHCWLCNPVASDRRGLVSRRISGVSPGHFFTHRRTMQVRAFFF